MELYVYYAKKNPRVFLLILQVKDDIVEQLVLLGVEVKPSKKFPDYEST